MDTYNYTYLNNPRAISVVLNIITQNNLIDIWREMNMEKNKYTWFRRNPINKAPLDYFLISQDLLIDVNETGI